MNIGIIGCGLVGTKRALSIKSLEKELGLKLVVVADLDYDKLLEFGKRFDCKTAENWKDVVTDKNVDIVFVCTVNKFLAEISAKAIQNNKHVLVEKPAGLCSSDITNLIKLHGKSKSIVKVGFNHRFHPLILKAKQLVMKNEIGELMWVRSVYGHMGRPEYDKEWRAKKDLAGGGEFLDQGVHVIDLARWFLGEFVEVNGCVTKSFWNMEVEDNGFVILKTKNGKVANIHASATEWTNKFLFEIYGKTGALVISGLQGNYGRQQLEIIKLDTEMDKGKYFKFNRNKIVAPEDDESWMNELREFVDAIKKKRSPLGDLNDALRAVKIVEEVYTIT